MRTAFIAVTTFLALLGIAISFEHFLGPDHYNPGFLVFPAIIGAHVISGAIYLACSLMQFFRPLREGWPAIHRVIGRIAILSGVVAGVTAIAITVLFPFHGPAAVYLVAPFALLFLFAIVQAFSNARAGNYDGHREWMIRAFAIGTGVATMRLIFVPAFLLLGEVSDERARPLSLFSFVAAFLIHLIVAEVWIRYSRDRVAAPT